MNTYLFSIHKRWNDLIFIEKIKKLEIRKTSPKPPFKAIVYEPFNGGGSGKVIGEFICNKVDKLWGADAETEKQTCLSLGELFAYANDKPIYGLHITAPKLYDKPRELGEFRKVRIVRGYHKKGETKIERLQNSDRVEVTYVSKAPQSYMRIQCTIFDKEEGNG